VKVWVLLPAFNEATTLPTLLEGLVAAIPPTDGGAEIIVVDDGSTDETAAVAASGADVPVRVVSHERNLGLARAMATALEKILPRAADDDVIVTMDADNTHPPALIPGMLTEIRRGADLVIASRYVPGGREEGVPALRRLLSRGIGILMRLRFGLAGVRDYSCGYRAYRAGLLRAAARYWGPRLIESRGFTVTAELLLKVQSLHPRVVEVPLHLRYDLKRGSSKMRILHTIGGYLSLLWTRMPSTTTPGSEQ